MAGEINRRLEREKLKKINLPAGRGTFGPESPTPRRKLGSESGRIAAALTPLWLIRAIYRQGTTGPELAYGAGVNGARGAAPPPIPVAGRVIISSSAQPSSGSITTEVSLPV
jgi:hypothetical protein